MAEDYVTAQADRSVRPGPPPDTGPGPGQNPDPGPDPRLDPDPDPSPFPAMLSCRGFFIGASAGFSHRTLRGRIGFIVYLSCFVDFQTFARLLVQHQGQDED